MSIGLRMRNPAAADAYTYTQIGNEWSEGQSQPRVEKEGSLCRLALGGMWKGLLYMWSEICQPLQKPVVILPMGVTPPTCYLGCRSKAFIILSPAFYIGSQNDLWAPAGQHLCIFKYLFVVHSITAPSLAHNMVAELTSMLYSSPSIRNSTCLHLKKKKNHIKQEGKKDTFPLLFPSGKII